ncbi:MAG TPA: four helix bundle protein [Longimicrobiaceae bacterium]|nr:four helix bundle protein [Longimicrobiaceae bacterium]
MRDFRKLHVWEKAHGLVLKIYRCTSKFPREEQYGLTAQLRRAAIAIPANLAEGYGRWGDGELRHFLSIAIGSAAELEYHLLLARDLDYIPDSDHNALRDQLHEVQKMLVALQARVRASQA